MTTFYVLDADRIINAIDSDRAEAEVLTTARRIFGDHVAIDAEPPQRQLDAYPFYRHRPVAQVEDLDDCDLGTCAYYAAVNGLPGADPKGTCSFGCHDEPACCTGEPTEGWPSHPRNVAVQEPR